MGTTMEIGVITLFPESIQQVLAVGIPRKAIAGGQLAVSTFNPRDYTTDARKTVDDRPFGGGPGMVMKVAPLRSALQDAHSYFNAARVVYLSPQGQRFNQQRAESLASQQRPLILLAGRYEGIDERLIKAEVDEEISLGDFVLSGGEIPALAVIDAIARLLPGVLGHEDSAPQDSFSAAVQGLLDCPHYTRPQQLDGLDVPQVLLSGDHQKIALWRRTQTLQRTLLRRPDLLQSAQLTEADHKILERLREHTYPARQDLRGDPTQIIIGDKNEQDH